MSPSPAPLQTSLYENVIVALDGSRAAAAAIPHALSVARECQAQLLLLRVLPPLDTLASEAAARYAINQVEAARRELVSRRSQAEGYLESLRQSLADSGVEVAVRIVDGSPAECIIQVASSLSRPLIVITAHGRSASQAADEDTVGAVASEILRNSRTPVMLVRH